MKQPSRPSAGLLRIIAPDPGTEIFLIDDRFRRIATGLGTLELKLPPGLYKVRFRSGDLQRDRYVEVKPKKTAEVRESEPMPFACSAPISNAVSSRPQHAAPAARISRSQAGRPGHKKIGAGSWLFLFVRDLAEQAPKAPFGSVTVCRLDGTEVAKVTDGEVNQAEGYAGVRLETDPGTYRVRVETGAMGSYEIFAVASKGWQTQVFLMAEDFPWRGETIRRPALKSALITMARPDRGFDPESPDLRMAEQARVALVSGRVTLGRRALEMLVDNKFEFPMLGVFGAHLMLLAPEPDLDLLRVVQQNLRSLLGPHPDVEALLLDPRLGEPPEDFRLASPPMLTRSWRLIVSATLRRPQLIPPGSLLEELADAQVAIEPWLMLRVSEAPSPAPSVPPESAEELFGELFHMARASAGKMRQHLAKLAAAPESGPVERSVVEAALRSSMVEGDEEAAEPRAFDTPPTVSELVETLRIPAGRLARAAQSVRAKLRAGILLRFESEGHPLNIMSFSAAEGVVFDWHRDASPLNLAIGLQPLFPQLLDPVRQRHDWRGKEFYLDASLEAGGILFSGYRGDPMGLPQGVYDLTVEVESMRFRDAQQRLTVRQGEQVEVTLHEEPERRAIRLRGNMDPLTARVIGDPRSVIDGQPLAAWLESRQPRTARKACLLNLLAKLRVPPAPAAGFSQPLTSELEFLYFADVDRVYASARPTVASCLEALVTAELWVKEGPPAAGIHRRLLDSLSRFGLDEAARSRLELNSYRQGGRNCLQIVVASPPEGSSSPTLYLDIDMDLGNPLWDLEGLIVHLGEVLDTGKTDHLALHRALDKGDTKDFLYYDVVAA